MISLALLIGGHGRRLGGIDKAGLVLPSGLTTSETLLATFRPLVDDAFAVGRADQADHPLSRTLRIVTDSRPDEGPLRGIATALAVTRAPWVFVVACDLAGVATEDFTRLATERRRGRLAVAWVSPRGVEPLCAIYHRALGRIAEALLARGERRARALLCEGDLVSRVAGIGNINLPGDFRARPTKP
ncbi:MAG: molybdenum cofactor guanylyltransferase [Myxococcota bacterium]